MLEREWTMVSEYAVTFYITPDDKSPFTDWLDSIKDPATIQRIRNRIDRFEKGNLGDYKPLTGIQGLNEARLNFGPGFRLYFTIQFDRIVLFYGGRKSSQRKDIQTATALYRLLLEE